MLSGPKGNRCSRVAGVPEDVNKADSVLLNQITSYIISNQSMISHLEMIMALKDITRHYTLDIRLVD